VGSASHRRSAVALSIAGSDSGGGAGVQMDLRTMQRLGAFATTAVAAVTAQNLEGVTEVALTTASLLGAQIDAVLTGFPVAAIKTGMLGSAALVGVVADRLRDTAAPLVIDPVMVATSGARLFGDDPTEAYAALWPRAALVTPNLDEAAVLLGMPAGAAIVRADLDEAANALAERLQCAVLLKGGHLDGPPRDTLVADGKTIAWEHDRINGANTHGSGCMLSAAITAQLALGQPLPEACGAALAFAHDALARGAQNGHAGLAAVEVAQADPDHVRVTTPTGS